TSGPRGRQETRGTVLSVAAERMRILITNGDERVALATARSLVAAGYRVHVAASRRSSLAGVSRGVRSWRVRSDPLDHPAHYAACEDRARACFCYAGTGGCSPRLPTGACVRNLRPAA